MTKTLSYLSGVLVLILTMLSLALSYEALQSVAFHNGLSDWRSYVWPLLIDGALVVFSVAVVVAILNATSPRLRWAMVALFTLATILFNLFDVDNLPSVIVDWLPFAVAVIPPVALFLSFETLMSMVRHSVKKAEISASIGALEANLAQLTAEFDNRRATLQAEIDKLSGKRDRLQTQVSELSDNVAELELSPKEKRQQRVPQLLSEGLTANDIAREFGVSKETIYRDIRELGIVTNGNGRG